MCKESEYLSEKAYKELKKIGFAFAICISIVWIIGCLFEI